MFKVFFLVQCRKPVACTQKHLWVSESQFAQHGLEVIATMAVEDQQFIDAGSLEHFNHIRQNSSLRAGIEVHVQRNVCLTCVDPKGDGGQHDDFGSLFPGQSGRLSRNGIRLDNIRAIRQVVVVGFGSSPGQDGQFVVGLPHGLPVGFGEDVGTDHIGGFQFLILLVSLPKINTNCQLPTKNSAIHASFLA